MVSDLSLHERSRRAHLHHQCSTTTSDTIFYIAPSSCVRGARISASFHHQSRRDNPSSDTTRVTTKKISFNPTSRRSSHARAVPAGRNSQRPAEHLARWHRFSAPTGRSRHGQRRAGAGDITGSGGPAQETAAPAGEVWPIYSDALVEDRHALI